ncbi:hypothetical protein INR49_006481, partial [Caranx melampygus]
KPSNTSVPIISALVPLALVLIAVTGFLVYKQKKDKHRPTDDETSRVARRRKKSSSVCQSNMEKLLMLLLFYHVSSAVEHSLRFYVTISSGHPNIPDYMAIANVDEVEMGYYDSSMKTPEARQDWVKHFIENEQEDWERLTGYGINYEQQIRGLHIIQLMLGCKWDDETQKVDCFVKYGYNGDDFLSFDLQTLTWIAAKPQAETIKQQWDGDTARSQFLRNYIDNIFLPFLKKALKYGSGFLQRTVPPSVSLLQKTPSSPVSCHATGFYPHRALLFWTKDGEELHEDKSMTMAVVVAVVVLVVVLIFFVAGFVVYKKKTAELPAPRKHEGHSGSKSFNKTVQTGSSVCDDEWTNNMLVTFTAPGDSELTENLKPT